MPVADAEQVNQELNDSQSSSDESEIEEADNQEDHEQRPAVE